MKEEGTSTDKIPTGIPVQGGGPYMFKKGYEERQAGTSSKPQDEEVVLDETWFSKDTFQLNEIDLGKDTRVLGDAKHELHDSAKWLKGLMNSDQYTVSAVLTSTFSITASDWRSISMQPPASLITFCTGDGVEPEAARVRTRWRSNTRECASSRPLKISGGITRTG